MIRIVTDSTCDLPPSMAKELNIEVIPLFVNLDGKSYLDGVELSREEFYRRLPASQPAPTTSAPGPAAFIDVYKKLIQAGASGIISIHIARSLSNTGNVAQLAAEDIEDVTVRVFDSGNLTLGTGLLVLNAARAAQDGKKMDEIMALLEDQRKRTYSYARLNTVEYIRRGGRLAGVGHGLASVLDIKPIMKMHDGTPNMDIVRTRQHADKKVMDLVMDLGEIEQIGFVHSNALPDLERLMDNLKMAHPDINEYIVSDVTPAIGAHVGPGAICVSAITKDVPHEQKSTVSRIVNRMRSK